MFYVSGWPCFRQKVHPKAVTDALCDFSGLHLPMIQKSFEALRLLRHTLFQIIIITTHINKQSLINKQCVNNVYCYVKADLFKFALI